MDFDSIRDAFARRGINASACGPVMGRRSNYARPLPPLTSVTVATLRTSCGREVKMDREGRDRLIAMYPDGLPALFVAGNGKGNIYVRCAPPPSAGKVRGNTVMVSRLLLGDEAKGRIIRYWDRDPFNLCRDNLEVTGAAGTKGREG
jgi:hypothetical protein